MPDSSHFDGDQGPNTFAPKPRFEYEAPSMFSQYKWLALVFLALIVAASIYLYRAPHKPLAFKPDPEPVYVEPLNVKPAEPAPQSR
jgi:hypothetical protein